MKIILRILPGIFLFLVLLLLVVLLQDVDPAQQEPELVMFQFPDSLGGKTYDQDSLKTLIGENKELPPGFEEAAAIALSAYPELKEVRIEMILTEGGAPMESTVAISSLLNPFEKRKYLVLLNDASDSYFDPILLRSLPFDAQVGILAHELGHIVYYERLNLFEFGKWGLNYLREDSFRVIHERTTDLMPVWHGLGSQIWQYARFVRRDPSCVEFYKEGQWFMDTYYMTDDELGEVIENR